MALVVGIPYSIGRAAYKAYKKHQAEKAVRDHGTPYTLSDPSHELSPEISYDGRRNKPSHQQQTPIEFRIDYHDPSSTGVASESSAATQAEIELALEQDEEFRRFIQQQKQVYLSQHRVLSQHSGQSSRTTSSAELPASQSVSQPPAYDDVIAGDALQAQKAGRTPPISNSHTAQVPTDPEEEIYLVSPTSVYDDSRVSEIDGSEVSPITATRASSEAAAELPGSSRHATELPVVHA